MPVISPSALVCGAAGGFIGSHLVKRLKREGFWVRSADLKSPEFAPTEADDFIQGDLCERSQRTRRSWRRASIPTCPGHGRRGVCIHRKK